MIGVNILTKDVELKDGRFATLSIWDIDGQQRFEFIHSIFYKGASGGLNVFDLTRERTFDKARVWLNEVQTNIL